DPPDRFEVAHLAIGGSAAGVERRGRHVLRREHPDISALWPCGPRWHDADHAVGLAIQANLLTDRIRTLVVQLPPHLAADDGLASRTRRIEIAREHASSARRRAEGFEEFSGDVGSAVLRDVLAWCTGRKRQSEKTCQRRERLLLAPDVDEVASRVIAARL